MLEPRRFDPRLRGFVVFAAVFLVALLLAFFGLEALVLAVLLRLVRFLLAFFRVVILWRWGDKRFSLNDNRDAPHRLWKQMR
ncbi:MAG: hypothetical protein MI750_07160 [Xanthomonadales bacterium]|nr:hypothetical protein [Xanthomonadales bacterium]